MHVPYTCCEASENPCNSTDDEVWDETYRGIFNAFNFCSFDLNDYHRMVRLFGTSWSHFNVNDHKDFKRILAEMITGSARPSESKIIAVSDKITCLVTLFRHHL